MGIIIPHRFIQRISTATDYDNINLIIIGTFNPGHPLADRLTVTEQNQFNEIRDSKKFKKFDQVKNFYDRHQNRFWKIMDYFNDKDFYQQHLLNTRNNNGLKHYQKMTRDTVYENQVRFCKKHAIFITDVVKIIYPVCFKNVYDNFPDSVIEKSNPDWNTDEIIRIIDKYHPKSILINFKIDSKSIPNITSQIIRIKNLFPDTEVASLKSTSGAAGHTYEELVMDWKEHFKWLD